MLAFLRVLGRQALDLARKVLALGGGGLDATQVHGRLVGDRLVVQSLLRVDQLALAPGQLGPQAVDLGAQRAGLEPQLLGDRRLLLRLGDRVAAAAAPAPVGQRELDDDGGADSSSTPMISAGRPAS